MSASGLVLYIGIKNHCGLMYRIRLSEPLLFPLVFYFNMIFESMGRPGGGLETVGGVHGLFIWGLSP